jgi:hypothetical protein
MICVGVCAVSRVQHHKNIERAKKKQKIEARFQRATLERHQPTTIQQRNNTHNRLQRKQQQQQQQQRMRYTDSHTHVATNYTHVLFVVAQLIGVQAKRKERQCGLGVSHNKQDTQTKTAHKRQHNWRFGACCCQLPAADANRRQQLNGVLSRACAAHAHTHAFIHRRTHYTPHFLNATHNAGRVNREKLWLMKATS